MATGTSKNKQNTVLFAGRRKWGLYFLLFIVGVSLLVFLLYSFWLKPLLEEKIMATIQQELAAGGPTEHRSLGYSLWGNRIWLEGLKFERQAAGRPDFAQAQIERIHVSGINWWRLYFDQELFLDEIRITTPELKLVGQPFADSTHQEAKPEAASFHIGRLLIEGGHLQYFEASDTNTVVLSLDSFLIQIANISPTADTTKNTFKFEDIDLDFQRFEYLTDQRLYALKAERISAHSSDRQLKIKGLHYQPQISRKAFSATKIGQQKAQLDARVESIILEDIDLPLLFLHQEIDCHLLTVDSFRLVAYRDKTMPEIPKLRNLPQQALMQLDWPLLVDTLRVTQSYIEYDELGPKSTEPGVIYFDDLYASFYNLTNHKDLLEKQPLRVDTQTKFMGSGLLTVQFQFFPLTPDFHYTYQGQLGRFEIENANQMLDPRLAVVLNSGQVHSLEFEVDANQDLSTGKMDFEYSELDAYLYNTENNRKKKFLSFIANLVTHRENRPSEKNYRQGQIYFEQIHEKPFFHNVWQAVFSGIRSTVFPDILLKKELDVRGK